jgi:hypothetical protein
MIACHNNLDKVSMKILENLEKCNIRQINNDNCCALSYALQNNMKNAILKLLEFNLIDKKYKNIKDILQRISLK